MTDKMLIDSYLLLLKSTVEVYVHGTLESTNKKVRNLLNSSLNDTLSMQDNTYTKMTENNWYKVENIDKQSITKVINKLNNN